jgi:flagellar assembly factor FliW
MSRAPVSATSPAGTALGSEPMVVEFPAGIPGFEGCRRFVVLTSPELAPLSCLKSLDPPEATFLAVDPRLVDPGYELTLREFERVRLGAGDDPLVWLALVTVTGADATANLRAPVVINPRRMIACQFIRDDSRYAVDAPLGGA